MAVLTGAPPLASWLIGAEDGNQAAVEVVAVEATAAVVGVMPNELKSGNR